MPFFQNEFDMQLETQAAMRCPINLFDVFQATPSRRP